MFLQKVISKNIVVKLTFLFVAFLEVIDENSRIWSGFRIL
jgi:hypothetical protein